MTPEELAKYHADKIEREKAAEAQKKAGLAAERERVANQNSVAEKALEATVPFFTKTRTAMGNSFEFALLRDTSKKIAGINLRLDKANAEIKKSPVGGISVTVRTLGRGSARIYNHITTSGDLTDENLGQLIKTLIDG
jgi:hypothetical protein